MRATTYLLLLLLSFAALAQGSLEVIQLRHRTAEQVIPVLRPLVEPGGALSGQYNSLIIRTSPQNLAQLRQVLASIDVPVRRLMISVRFDNREGAARAGIETDARISNRGSRADLRIEDSRSSQDERVDQRIQVVEGGRALIGSAQARPLVQREVIADPRGPHFGPVVRDVTVFQEANTGFEVIPRLSGGNVFLEIAPQRESLAAGGALQSERVVSTVSGRLGEWIELGGASTASASSGSGILSSRQASAGAERRVWVKVEEIR
jgi:hypothetical protein